MNDPAALFDYDRHDTAARAALDGLIRCDLCTAALMADLPASEAAWGAADAVADLLRERRV